MIQRVEKISLLALRMSELKFLLCLFRPLTFFSPIDESPAGHKLEYNGGFSNLKVSILIRNTMDVI